MAKPIYSQAASRMAIRLSPSTDTKMESRRCYSKVPRATPRILRRRWTVRFRRRSEGPGVKNVLTKILSLRRAEGMQKSVAVAVAIVVLACVAVLSRFQVEDYVIAPDTPEGWINIELSNRTCRSTPGFLRREFMVPPSGYLCTSNGPFDGITLPRYWLLGKDGRRIRLHVGKDVFRFSPDFAGVGRMRPRGRFPVGIDRQVAAGSRRITVRTDR